MNSFFTPQLAQEQASGAQAFRHPEAVFFNKILHSFNQLNLSTSLASYNIHTQF
jgi:hypothetical protein